jgi:hypothetical protein
VLSGKGSGMGFRESKGPVYFARSLAKIGT